MANGIDQTTKQVEEANDLYWSSSESVNRIADRLGLSKGSLYAAIKPKPSDSVCPTCSSQLGFANRTALERGTLSCPQCEHQFTVRPDRTQGPQQGPRAGSDDDASVAPVLGRPRSERDSPDQRPQPRPVQRASGQLVLGTALLAVGTGLLLSRFARRG